MSNNRPQKRPGMTLRHGRGAILLALLALLLGVGAQGFGVSDQAVARTPAPARPSLRSYPSNSVRWGFYITYNPNSWVSLQANAARLNYVSPWFYNLSAGGQVTGRDRPEVGALLKQVGAKN